MNNLVIICHNSGDIITNALEASKLIMRSNLVVIFSIVGLILSVVAPFIGLSSKDSNTSASANMSAALLSQTWSRIILMLLFLSICFPTSFIPNGIISRTVLVEDRSDLSLSGTVDDVPIVICLFGSIISRIGDELSLLVETAYQNPSSYPTTYRESGIGYPLRIFNESQSLEFPKGKIKTDAINFCTKCVLHNIINNESAILNILNSIDLMSFFDDVKYKSNARYVNVCDNMECSSSSLMPCSNMYNQLKSTINNNINLIKTDIAKKTGIGWHENGTAHDLNKFSDSIGELYQFLFSPPISGDVAILNSCWINTFLQSIEYWEKLYESTPSISHASQIHAERSLNSQLQLKESLWSKRFGKIRAIYEGGLYLISPILIILAITRSNFSIFFIICGLNLSLALIDPVYAIINQNILAKLESITLLSYSPSFMNINEISPIILQDISLVNYITTMILAITTWIISQLGGNSSMKAGMSEIDTATRGGNTIAATKSYGFDNVSMGNTSLYQESLSPTSTRTITNPITGSAGTYTSRGNYLSGSSGSPFVGNGGTVEYSGITSSGNQVSKNFINSDNSPGISNITSAGSINTGYDSQIYSSKSYNDLKQNTKAFNKAWQSMTGNSSVISYGNQLNGTDNDSYMRNLQTINTHKSSDSVSSSATQSWAQGVLESVSGSNTWSASKKAAAMNYIQGSGGLSAGGKIGLPLVKTMLSGQLNSQLGKRVGSSQSDDMSTKLDRAIQDSIKNDIGGTWSRAKSEMIDESKSKSTGLSIGASYTQAFSHLSQDSDLRSISFNAQKSIQGIQTAQSQLQSGERVSINGDKAFSDLSDNQLASIDNYIKNESSGSLKQIYSKFDKSNNPDDQKVALTETLANLLINGNNITAQELLDITSEHGGNHAQSMYVMSGKNNIGSYQVMDDYNKNNIETTDYWNDKRHQIQHSFEGNRNIVNDQIQRISNQTQHGRTINNGIDSLDIDKIDNHYNANNMSDKSKLDQHENDGREKVENFSSMNANNNIFQNAYESGIDDAQEINKVLKQAGDNLDKNVKKTIQYRMIDEVNPYSKKDKLS